MQSPGLKRIKALPLFIIVIISIACFISGNFLPLYAEQKPAEPPKKDETIKPVEKEEQKPQVPPAEIKPPETKEVTPKVTRKTTPGEISFFFDDADIYEVIQTVFGEVLKVNYIVDPKVKGRVNFRTTTPIPRADVLPVIEIILRLNGVAVVEERGLYRIISIGDVPREPAPIRFGRDPEAVELKGIAIVQIVQLQYITSSEMIKILTPLVSQGGSLLDIPPNFIIVVDTDANAKRLLQVVEIFDSEKLRLARPQVYVYPVQNSKAKDVANMLQQIFLGAKPAAPPVKPPTAPPTAPPTVPPRVTTPTPTTAVPGEAIVSEITRVFADEVTNSIIILATPEDFATIAEAIKKIDIVPRQVVIEGLIAQVQLRDELSLGIAWSLKTDLKIRGLKPFDRDINLSGDIQQDASSLNTLYDPTTGVFNPRLVTGTGFTFVGTDPSNIIRAYINALVMDSKAEILASPHILVSDNREASIQVGSQIPLATSTSVTPITAAEVTSTITSSVQYKDVGIILKVKPQVNESGLVSLEISQEISSLGANVTIAGQAFASINKTEAKTNLVAQDGQTIIIGGLIREDVTKSRSGIPLLSQIPILGYLFGSTSRRTEKQELIILLTPHVIKTQQDARSVTSDFIDKFKDATKKLKKEELMKGQGKDSPPEPPPSP